MTVEESLDRFGLRPADEHLGEIRKILAQETERESRDQGQGDTELMKLSAVQLFSAGQLEDVHLLAGAGLDRTRKYLEDMPEGRGREALDRIRSSEQSGDFAGFDVAEQMRFYEEYFGD
jgi:hypothetical protein